MKITRVYDLIDEAIEELNEITDFDGVIVGVRWIDKKYVTGECHKFADGTSELRFTQEYIEVASDEHVKSTVVHEVIHSMSGCMRHTGKWKAIADAYTRRYGLEVSRTMTDKDYDQKLQEEKKYEVVCEKCGARWKYFRLCKTVQHPELFNCGCGGDIKRVS